MEKLEHYLDQVCRGIAGPRSLRQHIRQELREHLLDAAAEHKVAGMTDEEAMNRALEDFGGPEQVRSELEATHGHRVMSVVIDKAMQWKENTMKAKWVWTTWAHLMLALVIAVQVAVVGAALTFIVPQLKSYQQDGWFEGTYAPEFIPWSYGVLEQLIYAARNWAWWVIPIIVLWGLFEWRVRSENKTFMRLSAICTAAMGMMVVVALTAAALILPLVFLPHVVYWRNPEQVVATYTANIDAMVNASEQAAAKEDWISAMTQAGQAMHTMNQFDLMGAAAPVLISRTQTLQFETVRTQMREATSALQAAAQAARMSNAERFQAEMRKFHELYQQFCGPTTKPSI